MKKLQQGPLKQEIKIVLFSWCDKKENEDNEKEKNEDEVTAQCDSSTYDI